MIHVCISGSLGTGVDPGDRAEAEEEERKRGEKRWLVFWGWDIAGCYAGGWLFSRRIAHPAARAADAHVEICQRKVRYDC